MSVEISSIEFSETVLGDNEFKKMMEAIAKAIAKGYDKEFLQKAQYSKVFASVTAPASDKFGDHVGGLNE